MTDGTHRQAERAERLRRDRMRRSRQRALLVVALAVVVVGGTAFALRPAATAAHSAAGSAVVATGTPDATRTADASGTGEASRVGTTTTVPSAEATKPAQEATRPAAPAAPAPPKPLRPAPGVKTIVVDKSEQRVTLYKANGKPVDSFRCSSGIIYPRVGTYTVFGHDPASSALADNTHFYYFTKFAKSDKGNNIGFHSNPQNPDGSVVGKIGKAVSHGCVRLYKADAKFVFTWAVTGTRVVVKK